MDAVWVWAPISRRLGGGLGQKFAFIGQVRDAAPPEPGPASPRRRRSDPLPSRSRAARGKMMPRLRPGQPFSSRRNWRVSAWLGSLQRGRRWLHGRCAAELFPTIDWALFYFSLSGRGGAGPPAGQRQTETRAGRHPSSPNFSFHGLTRLMRGAPCKWRLRTDESRDSFPFPSAPWCPCSGRLRWRARCCRAGCHGRAYCRGDAETRRFRFRFFSMRGPPRNHSPCQALEPRRDSPRTRHARAMAAMAQSPFHSGSKRAAAGGRRALFHRSSSSAPLVKLKPPRDKLIFAA